MVECYINDGSALSSTGNGNSRVVAPFTLSLDDVGTYRVFEILYDYQGFFLGEHYYDVEVKETCGPDTSVVTWEEATTDIFYWHTAPIGRTSYFPGHSVAVTESDPCVTTTLS